MPHCNNNISPASEDGAQAFSSLISHGQKVSESVCPPADTHEPSTRGQQVQRLQPGCDGSGGIFQALSNPPSVWS